MTFDPKQYPANWKAIRAHILERAQGKCETCGLADRCLIIRSSKDGAKYLVLRDDDIFYHGDEPVRLSEIADEFSGDLVRVVLTVAHLDHDRSHNTDDNLKALCQRCHLQWDMPIHIEHAKETRYQKELARLRALGQHSLF